MLGVSVPALSLRCLMPSDGHATFCRNALYLSSASLSGRDRVPGRTGSLGERAPLLLAQAPSESVKLQRRLQRVSHWKAEGGCSVSHCRAATLQTLNDRRLQLSQGWEESTRGATSR